MSYDIIGDIHGHAERLHALLQKMGYRQSKGVWKHPERQAIFVGDFIDRGPGQLEVIDTVRPMVQEGHALATMGNHEFNAIAWFTEHPPQSQRYLRSHDGDLGIKNRDQHEAFLAAVQARGGRCHEETVKWFLTLPLWLDLPGLRVVHACWHDASLTWLASKLGEDRTLNHSLMIAASDERAQEFMAVETILKGIEVKLPAGYWFMDKDKHKRHAVRINWWNNDGTTFRDAALINEDARHRIPDVDLPLAARCGYSHEKPVFFGHYWMTGTPRVLSSKVACVDYSVAKGGLLAAYRWEGESELDSRQFVSV